MAKNVYSRLLVQPAIELMERQIEGGGGGGVGGAKRLGIGS